MSKHMQRFWEYFIEKHGNEINENGFTEPLKFRSVFTEYKKSMNDSSDTPRPEIIINIDFNFISYCSSLGDNFLASFG